MKVGRMETFKDIKQINDAFGATGQPIQLDNNLVAIFHPEDEKWYVFSYDHKWLVWNEVMTTLDIKMLMEKK